MDTVSIDVQTIARRLGTYLLDQGTITDADCDRLLTLPEVKQRGLGTLLSKAGFISDSDLASAYSKVLELPLYSSRDLKPDSLHLDDLRESFLRGAQLLPVSEDGKTLTIATANPEDKFSLDALELASHKHLELLIATRQQIDTGLDQLFDKSQTPMDGIVQGLDTHQPHENEQAFVTKLKDQAAEAPIVRLVNLIIEKALEARASDIHIEAFENQLKIRYRIDGILRTTESPPVHSTAAIISRIKLMARMNIAERRLPQDGGFQIRLQGKLIDIRVSTTPTLHGESMVLRILDQESVMLNLKDLGFTDDYARTFDRILAMPNGIILVTGPTGSGKTTTLYAALKALNTDEKKIMTVEDPVEYQLPGINQIQVKPDIGLTFPNALRSIVRQDPDIIMIGEMRDLETARTAVQSALTGHLVFSTLHTNDAGSSVTRLLDMGVENYLVTSTLNAIVAQRLVRTLCSQCKSAYVPPPALVSELALSELSEQPELFHARGCPSCDDTGYRGRSVISEILLLNDEIKESILRGADANELQKLARESGMTTIHRDGMKKALAGITTLEEVSRVTMQ